MNIQFKHYNLNEYYENGRRKDFNENAAVYDGKTLKLVENKNGQAQFKKLSNTDLINLLDYGKYTYSKPLLLRLKDDFEKSKSKRRRRTRRRRRRQKRKSHTSRRSSKSRRRHKTRSKRRSR